MLCCCNCGRVLYTGPKVYFCRDCWFAYKEDIMSNAEWTVWLRNLEQRRRYRQKAEFKFGYSEVFLGDDEILVRDGGNVIVRTYTGEE